MELLDKRARTGKVLSQQIDTDRGQTAVVLTFTPDLAALEGFGPFIVKFTICQSDGTDTFVLGAVEHCIEVVGGVMRKPHHGGAVILRKQTQQAATELVATFVEEIRRFDAVGKFDTVHEFELGGVRYKQYALLPKVWVEAEHWAADAAGNKTGEATIPYRLDLVTDARKRKDAVNLQGLEAR